MDMAFSIDGKMLFFSSRRPSGACDEGCVDIWFVKKEGRSWSSPERLPFPLNSNREEWYPMLSGDRVVFGSDREGGLGKYDMYFSEFAEGTFAEPVNPGPPVNSPASETDTYIAPDNSYLIITSNRKGGFGRGDLYISHRESADAWAAPINLGSSVNTEYHDYCPVVSPDGRYFFFSRNGDIYWVDASILARHEPQGRSSGLDFPILKGPYLDQKPPGAIPEIFAPGIISTKAPELNSVFSSDGNAFYFSRSVNGVFQIMVSWYLDGRWTKPEMVSFSKRTPDLEALDVMPSPAGNYLYFISNRPTASFKAKSVNIWRSQWSGAEWSEPQVLPRPINTDFDECYPVFVADGSMYFGSSRMGTYGQRDIYYAQSADGTFGEPMNLGFAVNSIHNENDPFVAPDERYLIVPSHKRPDSRGETDLYISFRKSDGDWSNAVNMGGAINSEQSEYCPIVTPDGKYLFFTRDGDIFWVDAKVIEEFKVQN
jgi:Tol biopolymer transport system component